MRLSIYILAIIGKSLLFFLNQTNLNNLLNFILMNEETKHDPFPYHFPFKNYCRKYIALSSIQ